MHNRLGELMDEAGVSCAKVAQDLGFSYTFVNELKNHSRPMAHAGVSKVLSIAKYFDVSADYLLGESSDRRPYPFKAAGELPSNQDDDVLAEIDETEVTKPLLTDEENELLECYKAADEVGKHAILTVAKAFGQI